MRANFCDPVGPCLSPPPGGSGGTWYENFWWLCWGKCRDMVPPYSVRWMPCWWGDSQVYCLEVWRVCWDGDEYIHELMSGPTLSGEIWCEDEDDIPEDPAYGPGTQTDCWEVHTPCNP